MNVALRACWVVGLLAGAAGVPRAYNLAAVSVMRSLGVAIDELGGYVEERQVQFSPRPANEAPAPHHRAESRAGELQLPFNVHFTPDGYQQLSALVAASILRALEEPPAASAPRSGP